MAIPIYLIKGIASDGARYEEHKYPEGYERIENDHEVTRQWLVKLGIMFRDQWKLPDSM